MGSEIMIMLYAMLAFLLIAIVCVVGLPLLYFFSPWRTTSLGKMVMAHYISYAAFLLAVLVFAILPTDPIAVVLAVEAVTLMAISITSVRLGLMIWKLNISKKHRHEREKSYPKEYQHKE